MSLLMALAVPATAAPPSVGFLTSDSPFITLDPGLPSGASVKAIISSGDEIGSFLFEGLPDGVGIRPGADKHTVDVYVAHEQTTIPFFGTSDFQDASISVLTLTTKGGPNQGAVLSAAVPLGPEEGFLRFCSASMAGPDEGLSDYLFFTGEETDDIVSVPPGAPYGPDPSIAPDRQGGYAVVLNTDTGEFTQVAGMGRLNHENTVVVPGGWDELAMLTTDDTFNAPSSQLYMYLAAEEDDIIEDEGSLYAFRVTSANGAPVDPTDAFNGANDYLDLAVGDDFGGEFILVPDDIADGTTAAEPQAGLEDWSNDNNVFQAIRLEDLAYDENDPRVVYIADTGRTRIIPDDNTGRMQRGPGGTVGQADNGRIFKMVLNEDDPTVVDSLTVLADGDAEGTSAFVPFVNPDNIDTSKRSLMVQEDADNAKIWQYNQGSWRVAATVNDADGESSGIVDASDWFGEGTWLLDVQGHGTFIETDTTSVPGVTLKRESGQLLLMKIPAS
ncbi:MAG: PhoX family protein [Acidimicrobiia bacterium]|nr:PhoX family protein [Acidimicrobiia bacterium]